MLNSSLTYHREACQPDPPAPLRGNADRLVSAHSPSNRTGKHARSAATLLMQGREVSGPQSSGAWTGRAIADQGVLLSSEELVVIAIGKSDAASFWWRGASEDRQWRIWLLTILRATIGQRGVQSLANERLETLRLLVCMTSRRRSEVEATGERLISLGMTPTAVAEAVRLAGRADAAEQRRSSG